MVMIDYPSRKFLRTALKTLRDGNDLVVCVRTGWRSRLVEKDFGTLPSDSAEAYRVQDAGKKPPSIRLSLLMVPLLTVHNFALSGDYVMRIDRENGIRILYSRNKPEKAEAVPGSN